MACGRSARTAGHGATRTSFFPTRLLLLRRPRAELLLRPSHAGSGGASSRFTSKPISFARLLERANGLFDARQRAIVLRRFRQARRLAPRGRIPGHAKHRIDTRVESSAWDGVLARHRRAAKRVCGSFMAHATREPGAPADRGRGVTLRSPTAMPCRPTSNAVSYTSEESRAAIRAHRSAIVLSHRRQATTYRRQAFLAGAGASGSESCIAPSESATSKLALRAGI